MGSSPSKATLRAIELVKRGIKPIEAAKKAGIHRDTLYKSKLYKELKAEKAKKKA